MKGMDAQQREAVASLQRNGPQWLQLLSWLQENRSRVLNECARADDETHIRRLQGQAHTLAEVIEALLPNR